MLGQRLPAEWEPQDAILLLWPHNTEGNEPLNDIVPLYEAVVSVICDYADVIIALPEMEIENVRVRLEAMSIPLDYVHFCSISYGNSTCNPWARNCGPITVETEQGMKLLNFTSLTIGEKPDVSMKNVFQQLQIKNAFSALHETLNWYLEGGAIETDGQGTLLAKASFFMGEKSINNFSKDDLENRLKNAFGVDNIIWLEDGSVGNSNEYEDELVRFCPNNTIIYTSCDDEQDMYYDGLKKMEMELINIKNAKGGPYHLLPLPWPGAIYNDEGQRVSVSYANFLIVNEAVLVPIYNVLSDDDALEVIFQAFPGFDIIGIPCETLLGCGGSLHRIAMQLPEGVLGF